MAQSLEHRLVENLQMGSHHNIDDVCFLVCHAKAEKSARLVYTSIIICHHAVRFR